MEKTFLPTSGLKRNLMKRLKSGSSFIKKGGHTETDTKTQLFGQPLCKICPDDSTLPKPVTVSCPFDRCNVKYLQVFALKKCAACVSKIARAHLANLLNSNPRTLSPCSHQELLGLLRKRGPSTEGVFRKTCNSRLLKDIKEQLNCGMEVDMDAQSVVLLVGLLKVRFAYLFNESESSKHITLRVLNPAVSNHSPSPSSNRVF